MRTLMPSMPLARNAIVGLPTVSSASTRGPTISASVDSAVPHVRSVRLRMTEVSPDRRFRSGSTTAPTIACIS